MEDVKSAAGTSPSFTDTHADYWQQRWAENQIQFHKDQIHPLLVKHVDVLFAGKESQRFFVPLCGKSLDMFWALSLGHHVVGIEVARDAIEQFFNENQIKFNVKRIDEHFELFSSDDGKIKIYNGDFLKFDSSYEELFDCVWDRGSLVALPAYIRKAYAPHILKLLVDDFRYLLDTFVYDPETYPGPPHFVSIQEVNELYGETCKIETIDDVEHREFIPGGDKTRELIHLLTRKH